MRWILPVALITLTFLHSTAADRPNILFIAADDLADTLGCYGDPLAITPNLDRLAASGVCFERAYHQIPLCNPARASLMTGRRPDHTQVYDLERHFREALPDVVTLPQHFAAAGYFTARVGKIYHYDVPAAIGTDGFDDAASWQLTVNPKGRDKTDEGLVFNAEPQRKISAALSWLAAEGTDEEQTDGMIATEAIRLMGEPREKPFFLGVGFFRPHTPFVAPRKYFDLYPPESLRLPYAPADDRADIPVAAFAHNNPVPHYGLDEKTLLEARQAYYACVSFVDAQIGRLLAALDELGLAENTLVVFWSDNGFHLGEHGGVWQKRTLFEESAGAPLLIRWPGARGNGRPCRRVVEFVDLYPTLSEAAGLTAPGGLDGRSLVPLLHDPLAAWEGGAVTQILRPADDRLSAPVMGRSLRTERWRYTEWNEGEAGRELYDHAADPGEFENLALDPTPENNRVMERLRPLLERKARGQAPVTPFDPARL
jgi:iduronate 2-sulfatase